MKIKHATTFIATVLLVALTTLNVAAATAGDLLKLTPGDLAAIKTRKSTMTAVEENGQVVGVKLEYAANPEDFPGLEIRGPEQGWDLSGFTGVEAEISNLGKEPIALSLKISNKEPEKSNTEGLKIPPGETRTIKLKFGYSWGKPASQLDLARIVSLRIFESKPIKDGAFLIKRIRAFPVLDVAVANSQAQPSKPAPSAVGIHEAEQRLNVLFIASDDMRPQLGCYGDPTVKSPQLDALAKRGVLFERSYVQQALCAPSRISMLSGRYPSTTKILEIGPTLRSTMPDITTLPQHFKNNGYHTRSLGKIYHGGIEDPASWSTPAWQSKKPRLSAATQAAVAKYIADAKAKGVEIPKAGPGSRVAAIPAFEAVDCGDDDLLDGDCALNAIAQLREYAKNPSQPFFLAVGFVNPHVPWIAPKKYFDLYDPMKIPLAKNEFLPKDAPEFAAWSGTDFFEYKDVPQVKGNEFPEDYKRACLHGYFAAISYVDAQVGRLLAALDETGLAKNTIVVFWGDHGYYMGEHTWWGSKHNNYEGATRIPLIIATPNAQHAGAKTLALAQSVDIAPTLTELCGLPASVGFEGRSLKPVLDNPNASVNEAAFSWYPLGGYVGIAMRTDQWRFVEWTKRDKPPVYELYNQTDDPQNNQNLANRRENAVLIAQLSKQLRQRFPLQEFNNQPPVDSKAYPKVASVDPDSEKTDLKPPTFVP